uniref:Uncharacterized protein n=1 Tax=Arundo donax TaxID=35708 RepID=A0A0A9EGU9_ARUDO
MDTIELPQKVPSRLSHHTSQLSQGLSLDASGGEQALAYPLQQITDSYMRFCF